MQISEDELDKVIEALPGNKGRPFIVEDGVYDFGLYFYNLSESDYDKIKFALEKVCREGKAEKFSQNAPPDFFSDLAGEIEKTFKTEETDNSEEPSKKESKNERNVTTREKHAYKQDGAPHRALVEDVPLNPDYSFEQFVVGPNNRFTHAAALAVANAPGKTYNPFFIHGGVGLGKTHLMQAIGQHVRKNFPDLKVFYITTEAFVAGVIDAISSGGATSLRNFYKNVDILLVDDIQSLSQSESTQDEFFHIFNLLHQNKKQIVITCDRPPKLLTILEDRLRSRFEWGLIADIKSPSLETRVAILKKKEELEHLVLDDNILLYIASKLKSNVRELEGFLKRITAYSSLTKQDVDIELVKNLMAELLPSEEEPHITVAEAEQKAQAVTVVPPPPPPEKMETQSLKAEEIKIVSGPPTAHGELHAAPLPKVDLTLKPMDVVFFYPSGSEKELAKVKEKFAEVIKKHKLKFRLVSIFDKSYEIKGKINYALFTELCKTNKTNIAVVLSPPPNSEVKEDEFSNVLGALMSDEKISFQLVPWQELNKDYRYLNLALDITLSNTSVKAE